MAQLTGLAIAIALFIVVVGVLRGFLRLTPGAGSAASLPFRKKDYLLTKAERSFYNALRQAVAGEWVVFAKVRLLDLLWLPRGTSNSQAHRNRVQSKHVDFVLCEPDLLTPVLVIELDDASHERADRQDRDALVDAVLRSAGLPVLHAAARSSYVTADLARRIRKAIRFPESATSVLTSQFEST